MNKQNYDPLLMKHLREEFPDASELELEEHYQHYMNVIQLALELTESTDA